MQNEKRKMKAVLFIAGVFFNTIDTIWHSRFHNRSIVFTMCSIVPIVVIGISNVEVFYLR